MNIEDKGEDLYMDLPDPQVFDAEKGPLEKRIQRTFDQAVKDDIVDLRDTEYWFSTPEETWNSKPQRVHFMEQDEEPLTPQAWHPPQEGLPEGDERIAFTELEEGRVYLGMVTDVWLYHGVQEQWELAVDHIDVGEVVLVEVHKMRQPGLYRWPLQLKFCVKGLQDLMTPPDEYTSPVDHGWAVDQGWSAEDIAEAAGRQLEVPSYFMPHDEQKQAEDVIDGYGTGEMYWRSSRSEPLEDYVDDPLEDPAAEQMKRRQAEVDAAAADLLRGLAMRYCMRQSRQHHQFHHGSLIDAFTSVQDARLTQYAVHVAIVKKCFAITLDQVYPRSVPKRTDTQQG
eukprot:XP_001692458.1 predicted protein [Chlamydomonas reinhardtii]